MSPIRAYHRPETIEAALALIASGAAMPLAGGTTLVGNASPPGEVVDLQGLDLAGIAPESDRLRIGAMTTLRELMGAPAVPGLLADLARREAPNTIRNAATVGGTVATADPTSGLLAGLLVHAASVELMGTDGTDSIALSVLLRDPTPLSGRLITAVEVDVGGRGAFEATGRTPADVPIVLVAGRQTDDGPVTMAATGVAGVPVPVEPDSLDSLDPPGDFRGSGEFRRHLLTVLASRVLARLEQSQ